MRPRISVRNLTKIYSHFLGGKIAIDDVSFELNAGDRIGIIGRNGAGKSTLLSILAGISQPTSGTLEVQGHVTAIMTLGIGLREELTGRENIYLDGEIQGKSREEIDKVIDEIIAFADIGEFIDYPLRTYSTGMKARLAFSMIIKIDPEILIIDEALSVGDANFSQKAMQKIKEICAKGKIVIIVSHGLQSVVEMCNRCLWMDNGKIVMNAEPEEVTNAYREMVRAEDEAVLVGKFYSYISTHSYREGCHISMLEARNGDSFSRQNIFNTGDNFCLNIEFSLHHVACPNARLRIARLDGLVLLEDNLREHGDNTLLAMGLNSCEIALNPLFLAYGIYKITIELMDNMELVAERSIIIEVQTLTPPTGGRPALVYPSVVSVQSAN